MSGNPGIGRMDKSEETSFISDHKSGVLTLVDGDRPYAVPVEHYYDGKSLYFLTSSREKQRKADCIKKNANACYVIYDSRRDNPEIVSKGLLCRSVVIEGKVSLLGVREVNSKERGKAKVNVLKLDIEKVGNWICPRKVCNWKVPWYEKHHELVASL